MSKQREASEYEQFRLERLEYPADDDNLSAHFSNNTDREEDIGALAQRYKYIGHEGEIEKELREKLRERQKECNEVYAKYGELMRKCDKLEKEAEFYKAKYQEKVDKDKETKAKLQTWVKTAKTDLFEN